MKTPEDFFPQASCLSSPFRQSITSLALRETKSAKQNLSPSWTEQIYAKAKEVAVVGSDIAAAAFVNVFSG